MINAGNIGGSPLVHAVEADSEEARGHVYKKAICGRQCRVSENPWNDKSAAACKLCIQRLIHYHNKMKAYIMYDNENFYLAFGKTATEAAKSIKADWESLSVQESHTVLPGTAYIMKKDHGFHHLKAINNAVPEEVVG